MTHRSRRWGNCRSAQPSRDAARARRDGSVAGVECKSGFRQTWDGSMISLRYYWLINFDVVAVLIHKTGWVSPCNS